MEKIQANELIINRYFELNGLIVKAINFEGLNSIYNDIEKLKPIPLTEEWLFKLGFKHSGNGFYIHFGSLIELANIGYKFFNVGYKGVSLCHIVYVHQLQNLYFALTGEELTLNS